VASPKKSLANAVIVEDKEYSSVRTCTVYRSTLLRKTVRNVVLHFQGIESAENCSGPGKSRKLK